MKFNVHVVNIAGCTAEAFVFLGAINLRGFLGGLVQFYGLIYKKNGLKKINHDS